MKIILLQDFFNLFSNLMIFQSTKGCLIPIVLHEEQCSHSMPSVTCNRTDILIQYSHNSQIFNWKKSSAAKAAHAFQANKLYKPNNRGDTELTIVLVSNATSREVNVLYTLYSSLIAQVQLTVRLMNYWVLPCKVWQSPSNLCTRLSINLTSMQMTYPCDWVTTVWSPM